MKLSVTPNPEDLARIAARFKPTEEAMSRQAIFLEEQAHDRFETNGASGGDTWAARVFGGDDPILGGPGGSVDKSFANFNEGADKAVLTSNHPGARIFQYGTVGKGGTMPTIVPRKAKALFIPLTQKARDAYAAAPRIVHGPFGAKIERPEWVKSLIRGVPKKGGGVEPANADYMLLKKVDQVARPILPTGKPERAAQVRHWMYLMTAKS